MVGNYYDKGTWITDKELLFVYDGWNVIEEITLENSNETSKYFVWGLDLSQSLQGAGGVGGLLATVDGSNIYFYLYDGNGNVMQLVNAGGEAVASYEYGAFGNVIYQSGDYADSNVFRFSTKYFDVETGLLYYGYRYYSSELGRWLNRDPIIEIGHELIKEAIEMIYSGKGYLTDADEFIDDDSYSELFYNFEMVGYDVTLNLYNFVNNDGINDFDILGENPAGWIVAVIIVKGVAKWAIKKAAKGIAKKAAQKELKRKARLAAKCGTIWTQYKATEKACRSCNTQTTKQHNKVNCVCWSAAVAGRSFYIKKKCDYYWPAAVAKGSKKQEAAHKAQLATTIKTEAICCAFCLKP